MLMASGRINADRILFSYLIKFGLFKIFVDFLEASSVF